MLCTEIFSSIRLAFLRARPLRFEQAPAILAIVAKEALRAGVKKFAERPEIQYIPTAKQATAFTLGGFSPKLVVTGRLSVAAVTSPLSTELVVRHEMAHITNRDHRMWLVFISTAMGIIPALFADPNPLQNLGTQVLERLSGICVGICVMFILFRRREYLADAITVNGSKDRDCYLALLRSGPAYRQSWFHPSRAARLAALECGSPVLQTNALMLLILTATSAANAIYVLAAFRTHALNQPSVLLVLLSLLVVLFMFVAAMVMEFSKGPGRKIPLALSSSGSLPAPSSDCFSKLARLFGLGGARLDWTRIGAFASATLVAWMWGSLAGWILSSNHLDSSAFLSYFHFTSYFIHLLIWCLAYLAALRLTNSLVEAGTVVGIVAAIMFGYGERPDEQLIWFFSTLGSLVILGLSVKAFRNAWLGLWIGTMGETVLLRMMWRGQFYVGASMFALRRVSGILEAAVFSSMFVLVVKLASRGRKEDFSEQHET